jgi:hypothetical protein
VIYPVIYPPSAIHTIEELTAYLDTLPHAMGPARRCIVPGDESTAYAVYGHSIGSPSAATWEDRLTQALTSIACIYYDIASQGSLIVIRRLHDLVADDGRARVTVRLASWPKVEVHATPATEGEPLAELA